MATLNLRKAVYKRKQRIPVVSDKKLLAAIEKLPRRDQEIIKYMLGINRKRMSATEIGMMSELHGGHVVKQARVYQEFHQAIQKIREILLSTNRS